MAITTTVLLNEKELSKELGVKLYTVRLWRLQGGLPHFRTAGRIYYRLSSVLKWLEEQEDRQ